MVYKIILAPSEKKEFDKLRKEIQQKVFTVFEFLSIDPYSGKKLRGEYAGTWAVRAWPYRVMYQIFETKLVVYIVRIRHRKNVYR